MNPGFISLIPDPPAGFEHKRPAKRDLLRGQIALYADSVDECLALLDDFSKRVFGLIITEGSTFTHDRVGPHLWHLQIPPTARNGLRDMASFILNLTHHTETLLERSDTLAIKLDRCQRDYKQARSDHIDYQKFLGNKVQELRNEIRQRKEIEKQLNVFRKFAENSQQGVGWIDIAGNITYVNPALARLIGAETPQFWTGTPVMELYPEEDQQRLQSSIIPNILNQGSWSGELTILQAETNEHIPTQNSAFLIRDENGDPIYLANIVIDLREQKRTEQELLKIEKLEAVGFLAGGIAHDFNNLLAAILGNLDLARISIDPSDEPYQLLEQAKKASIRARSLTQQLLTFAKGGNPVRQKTSIDTIIMESATFILHGSPVVCHYDMPADLRQVEVDASQISQVIQNLVMNACNAMPAGGEIRITCQNIDEPLPLPTDMAAPIKITISDTGCGIRPEHLDKIFDPYFTTKQKGNGLGLAICHSIITKHGGTISAKSQLGAGSTFTIYLPGATNPDEPLDSQKPQKGKTSQIAPKPAPRAFRFLIMDDETMIRTVSQRILSRLGHEAFAAKDGEEALEIYRRQQENGHPIDISIMDLTIPGGMGGKEAVQEFLKLDPDAVVIVSSGYSGDPVMANYRDYGFTAAIAKPFEINDLNSLIDSLTA